MGVGSNLCGGSTHGIGAFRELNSAAQGANMPYLERRRFGQKKKREKKKREKSLKKPGHQGLDVL